MIDWLINDDEDDDVIKEWWRDRQRERKTKMKDKSICTLQRMKDKQIREKIFDRTMQSLKNYNNNNNDYD